MQRNKIQFSGFCREITSSRAYYMGIAMLMVVFFHCGFFPFNYFGYWGVEMFLLLSGFGINYSLSKKGTLIQFYLRRMVRILPAAIICGVLFKEIGIGCGDVKSMAYCGLDMWYIRTILFFYLLSPLIYFCLNKWKVKACITMLFFAEIVSCIVLNIPSDGNVFSETLRWSFPRMPIYILGMTLPFYADKKEISISPLLLLLFSLVGITVELLVLLQQYSDWSKFVWYLHMPSLLLFPAILMGIFCFAKIEKLLPSFLFRSLCFIGSISLEIYLIHASILMYCKTFKMYVLNAFVAKLICILISFLLAWMLSIVCRKFQNVLLNSRRYTI